VTIWSISFAVAALALGAFGASTMATSAEYGDLFRSAARLESGRPMSIETTEALAERAERVVEAGACRDDIVRAAMTIVLADLDRQDEAAEFDRWEKAITRARAVLRHAAGCNPADGNRWARLAMVEQAIAERPEELARLLSLSANLSPSEYPVLRARLVVWNKAGDRTRALARTDFERDVRTLLVHATPAAVAGAFRSAREPLRREVLSQAGMISALRRTSIADHGLEWIRPDRS
jgi:hypothetical protein